MKAAWASDAQGVQAKGPVLPGLYSLNMWWSCAGLSWANSIRRERQVSYGEIDRQTDRMISDPKILWQGSVVATGLKAMLA